MGYQGRKRLQAAIAPQRLDRLVSQVGVFFLESDLDRTAEKSGIVPIEDSRLDRIPHLDQLLELSSEHLEKSHSQLHLTSFRIGEAGKIGNVRGILPGQDPHTRGEPPDVIEGTGTNRQERIGCGGISIVQLAPSSHLRRTITGSRVSL